MPTLLYIYVDAIFDMDFKFNSMKKLILLLLLVPCMYSLSTLAQTTVQEGGGGVKNGDLAPAFSGKDQDGNTVSLDQ